MDKLIYEQPARLWREALPIGNGKSGVMVWGGKQTERLSFNDCTLWSGYPKDRNNPQSAENLNEVRQLVFEGKNSEADALCGEKLCGWYSEAFMPLGELFLHFSRQSYKAYKRELDIGSALHTVSFKNVRREAFSSYPDKITVYKAESAEPLVRFVHSVMKNGRKTAFVNYGCRGFCCNHNVDIWCKTSPVQGSPSYMYAPLCGAWLANELYAHYKNGGLEKYKNEILEIVSEAAAFVNDYLVLHNGFYVTAPSASPEAAFKNNGKVACLDYASCFEMSVAKQALINYLDFANTAAAEEIREKLALLYPEKSGSTGLLEWHADFPITEAGHRHFSPLYGFYPANTIKYHADAEKREWVRRLFNYRTDNSTQYIGWSAAWAICLCGRLHDGEKAEKSSAQCSLTPFSKIFSAFTRPLFFR